MSSRTPTLPLALALSAALAVSAPVSASASADHDTSFVAARATAAPALHLVGNGFGHGHGLSQYGAQGAATKGRSYQQIIKFYYPGTAWGQATGPVKVLISADTTTDLVVSARRGLQARSVATGRSFPLKTKGVSAWRILPTDHGRSSVIAGRRSGGWHHVRTVPGQAEFRAGGAPITLRTPAGDVAYRGALRSAAPSSTGGARDTVNVVSLDDYVRGVIPREMPPSWKPAALRAQAVAARTYAAFERREPRARHYQICDTSLCQVYGGVDDEYASTNAAVKATAGKIVTKKKLPAFTQFSASNGGWTSAGSQSYLVAKKDPYDHAYRGWTDTVTAAELERAFPGSGRFRSARITQRDGHGRWGGRVLEMKLVFSEATRSLSGETFRSYFGLNSSWFQKR